MSLFAHSIPVLHADEALLRLALAAILGGAVGVERELREREAGLRTHLLVAVGSALFTIVSAYGFYSFLSSGASVVTGIGFLGADAIIRQGLSIRGLTTAATLWVVAAIGLAVGAGYYSGALITTAVVLFSLWPLRIAAYRVLGRFRPEGGRLLVELPLGESPGAVVDEIERAGLRIEAMDVSSEGDRRRLALDVELPRDVQPPQVVARIADVQSVSEVRWSE